MISRYLIRRWLAIATVALSVLHPCPLANAQAGPNTTLSFDDQYHNSWTVREGVPPGLWQAKQTADGFLWLASETGLYRFDGIAFTRYQPSGGQHLLKQGPVTALNSTRDGGLWIAYRFGGSSYLHQGVVTNYSAARGSSESFFVLVQDRDGSMWGAADDGLYRFNGTQWQRIDESWGQHIARVTHLRLMGNGELWVDDGKTYYVLLPGEKHFVNTGLPAGKLDLTGDGIGWLSRDTNGLFPVLKAANGTWSVGRQLLKQNISSITHTPDGSLWFGAHDGIWRIRNINSFVASPLQEGALQSIHKTDGLTSDFVYALTVDREGSVWALTPNGLDQFRTAALANVPLPADMQHPFIVDASKRILVGTWFYSNTVLAQVTPHGTEPISPPRIRVGIHQMYVDPHDVVWVNAGGELGTLSGTTLTPVQHPADIPAGELKTRAMTMDRNGTLWISVLSNGSDLVYTLRSGIWSRFRGIDGIPGLAVTAMLSDSAGRVWMATGSSLIFLVGDDHINTLDRKQGIDSGGITMLQEKDDHVWVGGTENLDYVSNRKARRISYEDGSSIAGVTGLAEIPNGDIWLNCARGIVVIPAFELRDALLQEQPRVHARILNYLDGDFETPVVRFQASTISHLLDGRLYLLSRRGLVSIDPLHEPQNAIRPGIFVTGLTVDGQTRDNPTALELEKGSQNLQINYTATSLLIPQRVHFRYKLEGFDKAWQEVGTRRQAYYTHLPPGHYSFLVMASNNDGVWSKDAARLDFDLPPTFPQSIWFKLLCVTALIGILTAGYLLRIRLLTVQIQHRLFERLSERERIARDLHDTFFQGIQGLILRFNTGTAMLPAEEPAKQIFIETLEKSDRVMAEGRELVLDLRADDAAIGNLTENLARIGQQSASESKPAYKVFAVGHVRNVHPVCGTELLLIGQEAVNNAFKHANAEAVEVEVLYEKDFLKLRIRDDGDGIDEKVVHDGRRPGHLGLIGMNERATRIGARYSLWSRPGQGTEIEVEVPAKIAYAARRTATTPPERDVKALRDERTTEHPDHGR